MKNRYIIFLFSVVLLGIAAIQGCTKDEGAAPVAYQIAMPASPTPADNTVVPFTGSPISFDLTWEGTAATAMKWDVYFGDSKNPPLVASGISATHFSVEATTGGEYFWKVVATDANNLTSSSSVWHIYVNSNPGKPVLAGPDSAASGVYYKPDLKWDASDPEGNSLTYDVYLDTTSNPNIAYANVTSNDFIVPTALLPNTKYYWKIVAKDGLGGVSESSNVWSFTTCSKNFIDILIGDYTADEPAEDYSYGVSFTKVDGSTIQTDNYWNSGWLGVFTLDLVNNTYSMPVTQWTANWSGEESGTVDPSTGTMKGTYTIWYKGAVYEQGTHTYTMIH